MHQVIYFFEVCIRKKWYVDGERGAVPAEV